MSASQRSWCFTSFELDENQFPKFPTFIPEEIRYIVYQVEQCPETGKLHIQGYVEFPKKITMKKAQSILQLKTAHLEKRRGTRDEARIYCMKEESRRQGPYEFGDWLAGGQGARTDLHKILDNISQGKSDYEMMYEDPELFKENMRFIKTARTLIEEHKSKEYLKTNFNPETTVLNQYQVEWLEHIDNQNERQIT